MIENDYLFENFLTNIKELINKTQTNNPSQKDSFNPNDFLKNRDCILYKRFFLESINLDSNRVVSFFLNHIQNAIHHIPIGNTNQEQINFIMVIFVLLRNSFDFCKEKSDILNEKQHTILIEIGSEILKTENYDKNIKKCFSQLINSSSRKSPSQVVTFIYELDKHAQKQTPVKSVDWLFKMIFYSIFDIEALEIMISNVHTIEDANPQYYPSIIELIQESFHQIILDNPESYSIFFAENKDNQNIVYFFTKIDSWGTPEDLLSIKTVLYLLQPKLLNDSNLEETELFQIFKKLKNAQEPLLGKIFSALRIIFDTYLHTKIKDLLSPFVSKVNNLVFDYYTMNHSNLCKSSSEFYTTVYPVCLIYLSPNLFEKVYLPLLQKEEDYVKKLNQIVITVGPFIKQNKQEFYDIYGQLFKPINDLIQKNDKEANIIIQSIKHFAYFYRYFIYENIFIFHKLIENGLNINYFDFFYNECYYTMPVESPFWVITKYITDFMIKKLEKYFSNYSEQKVITSEFIKFHLSIMSFIKYLSTQNCNYLKDELISILYNSEAIAYTTFSSIKHNRSFCRSIIASIYTIIQKLELDINISVKNLYDFGIVCNAKYNAYKEFALINKSYLIDEKEFNCHKLPKGLELTINILMPRFEKLTRILLNKWGSSDQSENIQNQGENQDQNQQEFQEQNLNLDPNQKVVITENTLEELKSCIYVLFPLIRESSPRLEELIFLILDNNEQVGHECASIMATSLSPSIYYNVFQLLNFNFSKFAKKISDLSKMQTGFIENSLELMKILLDYHTWIPNSNYSNIFTSIVNNTSALCAQLNIPNLDILFCKFIISLFEFTERIDFEIKIDSKVRNYAGKTIVSWINRLQAPEKEKSFEFYYLALYSILDGINFQECTNSEALVHNSVPFENFLFYYSQRIISETLISISVTSNIRKTSLLLNNGSKIINCDYCLQQNQSNENQSTLSILNPILKKNFDLCINHTISRALDPKAKVRTAFLNALSSALTPETYQQFVNPVINLTVTDLIFDNDLEILKLLAKELPYKSGEIAEAIVKASALKKIEMQVFETLAKIEIQNNKDPTRNTLFRGNGLTSSAISYFPKYFANNWAEDLIHPLLSLDSTNLKMFWNALILRIEEMFQSMPARMKLAIRILFNLLAPESTEIAFSMLSGFVFLRFLCPMIAKVEGLVKASSLLMKASIKPTLGESKSQFDFLKLEIADAYQRIQKLFQNIVCYQLYIQNGVDYKPPPIEIKPLNPPLDAESITSDLIAALWTQMSFMQKTFHQTPDDLPLHSSLDQLITKLKEAGKPHRKIEPMSISEVLSFESMLNQPLYELLQTNQQQDPSLEKWFYLAPLLSRDRSFIFMMNMSEIKQPFTAQQLCAYMFSQILSIGDAKYSIFVEFADFEVEHLPPLNQVKKTVKLATNEMVARLMTVYVSRVQENSVNYLSKASKLLKKLPLKIVTDLKMIRDEIGELKLSEKTNEFFSTPENSYQMQEKSDYPIIRLHQKSIQIIYKHEINQVEFFASDVFLLSSIENIGHSQASKSSSFTIRIKSRKTPDIPFPASIPLRSAVSQLLNRYNDEKHEKRLCVDRSSFASLLIIISFLNMLNENSDQELKATALNLYNTTIESSGLKTTVEKQHFSKNEVPFSMLQIVELLSRDLASSNPNEVHSFFLEFTKVISFLDSRNYAYSERFLQPWLYYALENIITNQTTLDCLARISTQAPKKCFIQFNKGIWQNFSRIDLLDPLFDKLCTFDENCFASIFLLIAVKYPVDVTRFLVEKLSDFANDLSQRQFALVAEILNSLIVSELFDYSYKAKLLHKIALVRLLGLPSLVKPCFIVFQALHKNQVDMEIFSCTQSLLNFINDDVNNNNNNSTNKDAKSTNNSTIVVNQRGDYRRFIHDTAKLSLLYLENYSEELYDLFMNDAEGLLNSTSSSLTDSNIQKDLISKLNGIIFISTLENDYSIALEVYKIFYNFNPFKTLAACSVSLSLTINSIPNNLYPSLFFTSIAALLYTGQIALLDLICSILTVIDMNIDEIVQKVQPKSLELFDSIIQHSFSSRPILSFLLIVLYFYGLGNIELPNIFSQKIIRESKNSLENSLLSVFRFLFDESLEDEIISIFTNDKFDQDWSNIAATILILYLWHPSDHMKRLLIQLLEIRPDCFINIDFTSIYARNANQFKFVDTKLLILLTKATRENDSNDQHVSDKKYQLIPIIASIFSGDQFSTLTLDQTKSIFHSFFSS